MKRHPGLHALSQHHHFALIQAWQMRQATQAPAARRAAALRQVAQKFVQFWKKTGQQHFREEEEILLPAYARHTRLDQDPEVMRMLADHAEIRARIQDLEKLLTNEAEVKSGLEKLVAALAKTLHDHVRLEENHIFPRMEAALGEVALQVMAGQLTRLHRRGSCEV